MFALIMFLTLACSTPGLSDSISNSVDRAVEQAVEQAEKEWEEQHHPVQYLVVSDKLTFSDDGFIGHIIGTIKNTATFAIDYVEVEFAEFDEAGNQIGTTFDNITDLQPGATWKFDAPVWDDNVKRVKLISVDALVY